MFVCNNTILPNKKMRLNSSFFLLLRPARTNTKQCDEERGAEETKQMKKGKREKNVVNSCKFYVHFLRIGDDFVVICFVPYMDFVDELMVYPMSSICISVPSVCVCFFYFGAFCCFVTATFYLKIALQLMLHFFSLPSRWNSIFNASKGDWIAILIRSRPEIDQIEWNEIRNKGCKLISAFLEIYYYTHVCSLSLSIGEEDRKNGISRANNILTFGFFFFWFFLTDFLFARLRFLI